MRLLKFHSEVCVLFFLGKSGIRLFSYFYCRVRHENHCQRLRGPPRSLFEERLEYAGFYYRGDWVSATPSALSNFEIYSLFCHLCNVFDWLLQNDHHCVVHSHQRQFRCQSLKSIQGLKAVKASVWSAK